MEIELPDGTVLDAPDDADVQAVVRGYRLSRLKSKNPAEYDSKSSEFQSKYGPVQKGFREGIGSGMTRMTRGLGNLQNDLYQMHPLTRALGLEAPGKEIYSDEAIKQQDETDAPLAGTGKGAAGQVLGQTAVGYAATAPIGGLRGLSSAPSVLARTLAAGTTRAGLEGLIGGAAMADHENQGAGAVKGGATSAALDMAFRGGGRLLSGLVKKNEATEALQQLASQQGEDIFVPISQAADDKGLISRGAKVAYGEGLSLFPGVKGQLTRQAEQAAEKVRELALKEATPSGVKLPGQPGKYVQESMASIRQGFDDAFDETIKTLDYRIPADLRTQLITQIRQNAPNIDSESADKAMKLTRGLLRRFSDGKANIEGSNLLIVREELRKAAEKAPDYERAAYTASSEVVEDLIKKRLQVQGLWDRFADLEEPARHMKGLEGAVHSARAQSGRFTPNQLARNAKDATQLDLGQTAGEALKGSPAGTSFAGRSLLSGAATLGGLAVEPVSATSLLVGSNLLATKTAQKALMGDTAAQRAIVDLLKKHPEAAESVQRALRQAAATSAGESGGP